MQWLQLREEEESMSSSMETPIVSMRKWNDMIWMIWNHLLIWFDCLWLYLFICLSVYLLVWYMVWYVYFTVHVWCGISLQCMHEWMTDWYHTLFFFLLHCIAFVWYDMIDYDYVHDWMDRFCIIWHGLDGLYYIILYSIVSYIHKDIIPFHIIQNCTAHNWIAYIYGTYIYTLIYYSYRIIISHRCMVR